MAAHDGEPLQALRSHQDSEDAVYEDVLCNLGGVVWRLLGSEQRDEEHTDTVRAEELALAHTRGLPVAGRLHGFVCLNLDSVQCQPAMKILQSLHIDKDARALLDSAHRIAPSMAIRLGYFIV